MSRIRRRSRKATAKHAVKATRRSARRQAKLARKTVAASPLAQFARRTPPVRLIVALAGIAAAAVAAVVARRRSGPAAVEPAAPLPDTPVRAPTPPPAEHQGVAG
jgi:hypothetical protein